MSKRPDLRQLAGWVPAQVDSGSLPNYRPSASGTHSSSNEKEELQDQIVAEINERADYIQEMEALESSAKLRGNV